VDDWMKELGIKKIQATRFYLKDAIEQSMQGKSVTITKTEAKGCLINDL